MTNFDTTPDTARRTVPSSNDAILGRFPGIKILVIGDFMLDRFVWGHVDRISPEAPVPVVRVSRESLKPGGAGNVANNIRSLGGEVTCAGLIGDDEAASYLKKSFKNAGIQTGGLVTDPSYETITKTRIIAHNQQVVRLDIEPTNPISPRTRERIQRYVKHQIHRFDVCIVSDYGKGVVDSNILAFLAANKLRKNFVYVIDPKRENFAHYKGASLIKPNQSEASEALHTTISNQMDIEDAGPLLLQMWDAEAVLISRGEEGMSLFRPNLHASHFRTAGQEIFDVTGAGDTVIAMCALCLGAGATPAVATLLANRAAAIAVSKVGTATVTRAEVKRALKRDKL